ncbi:type II secretion system protein [Clostridium sulfidigenes]|uniref:type II secretion system protein n=1 Tax=Clostridium sulfidigenes TaxID=318464 RepID=UPI0006919D5A|nr:type II secretion system protein [Clostridium sulfidigenes]
MNKKINRTKKKGFTLIELLVVLGIIGVLALAVAPTMVSKVDEAKEKTDVSSAKAIAMAVKTEIIEGKSTISGKISDTELPNLINKYFDGKIPTPQSKDGNFIVNVADNKVTVTADGKEFYPNYVEDDTVPASTPVVEGGGDGN